MFTGIVSDIGRIEALTPSEKGLKIKIATSYDLSSIALGASIACNGTCLTVTEISPISDQENCFTVEAWEEALRLTNISRWRVGTKINLERSLKLGDEMGGHLVSGHVDGIAKIIGLDSEGAATRFHIEAPEALAPFIAPKGSVALDGTSLTVNKVNHSVFDVLLIKHSLAVTNWDEKKIGDLVNIEVDTLARYAARILDVQFKRDENK